jgi:3-oxoadipate enol-lactonase
MPFLQAGGRALYFECHGDGPPVLFLHGAGSNAATWWQQLPAFCEAHRCITLDLRCFGRSAAPLQEFGYARFVADLLALLDHLQLERVMVVGQSLGGMVGLRLVLEHGERVAGFAACDSLLGIALPLLIERIKQRPPAADGVAIEQRALGRWFLRHRPEQAQLYAQINNFNPSGHSLPPPAWQAAIRALTQPEQLLPLHALRRVSCPTLLLVGEEDPLVPATAMQSVAQLIAGSELVVVPRAGHSAYFEQPDIFNRHVLDFIARRVCPATTTTTTGDMR